MTFGKISARSMMYHGILPPGARWVEYLESTGTQWIDTGLKAGNGYAFEYWGNGEQNKYRCTIGGGEANNVNEIIAFFYSHNSYVRNGSSNATSTSGLLFSQQDGFDGFTVVYDDNNVSWTNKNGVTQSRSLVPTGWTVEDTTYPFILFGHWRGSVASLTAGKIPFVKIKRYGALVRDFRPIAIGNKGYMLDLLTGEYEQYGNQGTGEFVIGPTIAYPERERERESKRLFGLIFHFDNYSINNIFESDFALSYLKEAA